MSEDYLPIREDLRNGLNSLMVAMERDSKFPRTDYHKLCDLFRILEMLERPPVPELVKPLRDAASQFKEVVQLGCQRLSLKHPDWTTTLERLQTLIERL